MEGLELVHTSLDDVLCLSKDHFNEHLEDVEEALLQLKKLNLKVDASKSSFGKTEVEYRGYVVTGE